jgi:hypothetical protein
VLESKIKRLEGEAQEARDQGALATSGAKEAAAQQVRVGRRRWSRSKRSDAGVLGLMSCSLLSAQ